jgi:hypothetical protein
MLHNRLSQLFQRESDRLLKSFLGENQDLLKKYVEGGVAVVGTVLKPVNSFMRHLLTVQGLDPDTTPGESQRLLTQQALTSFFESKHDKDFDDDYDLSWVAQKFEKTRGTLKDLALTQDKFMQLTDLSKMGSGRYPTAEEEQEIFRTRVTPEPDKRELNIGDKSTAFDPGNAIQQLKDFVESLDEKKVGIKTTKKKLNKGKRVGSGPKVQRIANTEPIKEGPSTLRVDSDRKERPPTKIAANRNLRDLAQEKRAQNKAILESTPEFKDQVAAKLARATELTQLMVEKGLCDASDKARQEQINQMLNWHDNNFDSLERVINRYAPTKDAIAENKFKGSFRRIQK